MLESTFLGAAATGSLEPNKSLLLSLEPTGVWGTLGAAEIVTGATTGTGAITKFIQNWQKFWFPLKLTRIYWDLPGTETGETGGVSSATGFISGVVLTAEAKTSPWESLFGSPKISPSKDILKFKKSKNLYLYRYSFNG